jgi:hypothetical protein
VSEEQSVQVKNQAGIQRPPVLMEQVVLGVAIAGQFLFASVAQQPARQYGQRTVEFDKSMSNLNELIN